MMENIEKNRPVKITFGMWFPQYSSSNLDLSTFKKDPHNYELGMALNYTLHESIFGNDKLVSSLFVRDEKLLIEKLPHLKELLLTSHNNRKEKVEGEIIPKLLGTVYIMDNNNDIDSDEFIVEVLLTEGFYSRLIESPSEVVMQLIQDLIIKIDKGGWSSLILAQYYMGLALTNTGLTSLKRYY